MRHFRIDECGSRGRKLVIEGSGGGWAREVLDVDGMAAFEAFDWVWGKYCAVFF